MKKPLSSSQQKVPHSDQRQKSRNYLIKISESSRQIKVGSTQRKNLELN